MAYRQTQFRVCIEFLRANQPGQGRIIRLNYAPNTPPPQLMGRIHPVRRRGQTVFMSVFTGCLE
jgi:hypothetical protein